MKRILLVLVLLPAALAFADRTIPATPEELTQRVDAALAEALDHAIHSGELDLQGHLDPTTVTVDEIQAILDSVAHDDGH